MNRGTTSTKNQRHLIDYQGPQLKIFITTELFVGTRELSKKKTRARRGIKYYSTTTVQFHYTYNIRNRESRLDGDTGSPRI